MKAHEYAETFPMMPEDALQKMAEDIKKNGQTLPIIIHDGQILDGRNRYAACKIAGIEPVTQDYTGDDPAAAVVSYNIHRRQMDIGVRAVWAEKWARLRQGGDRKSAEIKSPIGDLIPTATKSRDEASTLMGIGKGTLDRTKQVAKHAPELLPKIESGEMTVNKAYESIREKPAPKQDPDPLVVDGLPAMHPIKRMKIIESEGMRIWGLAKAHLDRINKNDEFREDALNACIEYCKKRISTKK